MIAVASQRTPGLSYEVRDDIDGWRCTCPSYQFRRTCRHIKEATMAFNNANYVPVAERLADAQGELMAIEADPPVMLDGAMGYIRVQVYLSDGRKATGTASFRLDLQGKGAQATNPIEDCETSAVGRALAFLGYQSNRSIASREEVQEAQRRERAHSGAQYQEPAQLPAPRQVQGAQPRAKVVQVEAAKPSMTLEEAEARFFGKYGAVVGASRWENVKAYLGEPQYESKPATVEEWFAVARRVQERQKQNAAELESIPA